MQHRHVEILQHQITTPELRRTIRIKHNSISRPPIDFEPGAEGASQAATPATRGVRCFLRGALLARINHADGIDEVSSRFGGRNKQEFGLTVSKQ